MQTLWPVAKTGGALVLSERVLGVVNDARLRCIQDAAAIPPDEGSDGQVPDEVGNQAEHDDGEQFGNSHSALVSRPP